MTRTRSGGLSHRRPKSIVDHLLPRDIAGNEHMARLGLQPQTEAEIEIEIGSDLGAIGDDSPLGLRLPICWPGSSNPGPVTTKSAAPGTDRSVFLDYR